MDGNKYSHLANTPCWIMKPLHSQEDTKFDTMSTSISDEVG